MPDSGDNSIVDGEQADGQACSPCVFLSRMQPALCLSNAALKYFLTSCTEFA